MAHSFDTQYGTVFYQRRGLGDAILLVHGIYPGATHEEFAHNVDALARHFTVYAIDLLGFGESAAPRMTYTAQLYDHLLRDFIIRVIGQPAHVVASGEAANFAVPLAVHNDTLVRKLVLIVPNTQSAAVADPLPTLDRLGHFLMGTLALGAGYYETISSKPEIYNFLLTRFANPKHITSQLVERLHTNALLPNSLYPYVSFMSGHFRTDVFRFLRSVRSHILVVWGELAGEAPVVEVARPATWSRGKKLEIIPHTSRWPHVEQSRVFNETLEKFLSD